MVIVLARHKVSRTLAGQRRLRSRFRIQRRRRPRPSFAMHLAPLSHPHLGKHLYPPDMLFRLPFWLAGFLRTRPRAETSRLIVGSTGSGKSEGEMVELVRLAD